MAQRYEATILDRDDNQPVAYANVGILGTATGTNSDETGRFVIMIPADAEDKMLQISLIGYEENKIKVSQLISQKVIYLKRRVQLLEEVLVKPAKLTFGHLGNDVFCQNKGGFPFPFVIERKKKGVVVKTDTLTEIGTLMKVKHRKTFIDSVKINVSYCTYPEILYRLNLYEELDGTFKNILREPVYLRLRKEQIGPEISVNLTDKNLVVNNDFIVSIEKVKELGNGAFGICPTLFGSAMYMRVSTLNQRFVKLPVAAMGISAYVTFSKDR